MRTVRSSHQDRFIDAKAEKMPCGNFAQCCIPLKTQEIESSRSEELPNDSALTAIRASHQPKNEVIEHAGAELLNSCIQAV